MTTKLASVRCEKGRAVGTVYTDDQGARRIRIERVAHAQAEPFGWYPDESDLPVDEHLDTLADSFLHTIPAVCGCGRNVTVDTRAVRTAVTADERSIIVAHPARRRRPRRLIICEAIPKQVSSVEDDADEFVSVEGVAVLRDDSRTRERILHRTEAGVPTHDGLDTLTSSPRVVCPCGRSVTLNLAVIRARDTEPSAAPIVLPHDA